MPSIISDCTYNEYSKVDGVRASDLKKMAISPAHFKHQEDKENESLSDGRLIHSILLEPKKIDLDYCIEKIDRRTTQGKERYSMALLEGKQIVDPNTFRYYQEIPYWLGKNIDAHNYVFGKSYENEVSLFAKDNETGLDIKCRFDRIDFKNDIAVDIKTSKNSDQFYLDVGRFMYHLQQAFYEDVYFLVTGRRLKKFVFVVIEKTKPFTSRVFVLHPDSVKNGRVKYKKAIQQYKDCLTSGDWDVLPEGGEKTIVIPNWYEENEEDILNYDRNTGFQI